MKLQLLGGLTADIFLRDYWQKKPLLVRNAVPGFTGLLERDQLIELACHEDAQARLITCRNQTWEVAYGPFVPRDFKRLPKHWTILLQGLNHFLPQAQRLLLQFNFVPYTRLDDLMVSYAPPGGGVGPHFDSYDVFLLQGMGRRRWQVGAQRDMELVEDAPIRVLRRFQPEQEWVLEPGDMLYLPPRYAHDGVALDECMTYSIGFRAPSAQELVTQFLVYLQDRVELAGMYADPGLRRQSHPAQIGDDMVEQVEEMLGKVRWGKREVQDFLGHYLSEPKPHIFFDPPRKPLTPARFAVQLERRGVHLSLKTQMLFRGRSVYINGESCNVGTRSIQLLMQLADGRVLPPGTGLDAEAQALLYQWYCAGYIGLGGLS
ncbi:MAG: cupin domain-containing protein [Pseudomonadota bacterium]